MIRRVNVFLPAALLLGLLGGCAPGHEDLRQWMTEQRSQMRPNVTPLSEPKKYVPQDYVESAAADPFGNERLTQALRRESGVKGSDASLITPELNRRKEPLEAFPLDAMTMVGSLDRGGKRVALLRVDKLLYQVRVGEHLGQNYGRVTKITEGDVVLREIVQDAAGEWIERNSELQLQEKKR
ncbi:MAG: pilus assembly protein PilP [Proteobacteria bacterium]|nr:pilus assembly protein PilP [Pseudomonadota bacterium]